MRSGACGEFLQNFLRRVKGKQVKILYEPVTVTGEWKAITSLAEGLGRPLSVMIHKPGNLPLSDAEVRKDF